MILSVFSQFPFGHDIVCLFWCTASGYLFDIFKPFLHSYEIGICPLTVIYKILLRKLKIEQLEGWVILVEVVFKINTNINTLWDYFKTKCTDIMQECIPSKTTSTRITKPWITKDLRTLSRRKQKLYNRAKLTHKNKGLELIQCNKETRLKEIQGGI